MLFCPLVSLLLIFHFNYSPQENFNSEHRLSVHLFGWIRPFAGPVLFCRLCVLHPCFTLFLSLAIIILIHNVTSPFYFCTRVSFGKLQFGDCTLRWPARDHNHKLCCRIIADASSGAGRRGISGEDRWNTAPHSCQCSFRHPFYLHDKQNW